MIREIEIDPAEARDQEATARHSVREQLTAYGMTPEQAAAALKATNAARGKSMSNHQHIVPPVPVGGRD